MNRESALLTVAVLLSAASRLFAQDSAWVAEGLQGKAVYSLALGQTPRTLFAATSDGFFRSTEAERWTQLQTPGIFPEFVAVDPSNAETVYAGGLGGLFRSIDSGSHFRMLSSMPVRCLAIDPAAPTTLYVGSGYTFDATTASAGTVHKSTNGGASWSDLNTTSLVDGIASLVLDPRRPGIVYAGASIYYDYPGYPPAPRTAHEALIGTDDGGVDWSRLLPGSGIVEVRALAVDPQLGTVYAGTGNSVFRSGNFGADWTRSEIGLGLTVAGIQALVVDPANPTTLYAGTNLAGVFRSLDGGSTWTPMNDGLFDDETFGNSGLFIHSLVLDPAAGVLRAGTENGVFAIRPASPSPACTPTAEHLCLLGGRYRATVMAQIPDWRRGFEVGRGAVLDQADRFGSFSFPDFTGDPAFPEVVVKIVDPGTGREVWVFHGSLTGLPYILTVTDTATGRIETYTNDAKNHLCGAADTSAFFDEANDPCFGCWDYLRDANVGSGWMPEETGTLSLLGGRFSVTLSAYSARHNRTEPGTAAGADRYGYFSLPGFTGDPSFPEVYVKMVDFRAVTGKFWVFYSGVTSLDYTLTVTDSVTGAVRVYESAASFCGGADTEAFTD
jgi:photosystem II stability/assembly factor-like uncharacterized protein